MARLLLELIFLVLLVSLVSCQVITSHSKSGDDSKSASSITLGVSLNTNSNFPSSTSTSTSASKSASSTNSDSPLDSDSSLSSSDLSKYEISEGDSDISSSSISSIESSDSSSSHILDYFEVLPDEYPFHDYYDDAPIENGCAFLTQYIITPNYDKQILDMLKQVPELTNCSNVDNSLASLQLFSNIVRNLCPTNETTMSKSMFRQVESFLNNNIVKEMYFDTLKENCRYLFDSTYDILKRFYHDLKEFTSEASDF